MIIKRDSNYLRYVIKVPEKRVSLLKWEEGESQIVFIARCVRNLSEPAMRCLLAVPVVSAVHCCIGGRLHGIVFRLTLALTVTGFQPACIGTALAAPSGVVAATAVWYSGCNQPLQAPGCTCETHAVRKHAGSSIHRIHCIAAVLHSGSFDDHMNGNLTEI